MADEESKNVEFPADWEGLRRFDPVMAGLPDMVQAEDFTPQQSAEYAVADGVLVERIQTMHDAGLFGGKMPTRKGDVEKAARKTNVAVAEYVGIADQFYRGLAVDADAYAVWTKGRSVADLFGMFSLLHRFYGERLGKSSDSKKRAGTAE